MIATVYSAQLPEHILSRVSIRRRSFGTPLQGSRQIQTGDHQRKRVLKVDGAPEFHRQPILEVWKTREGLEHVRARLAEQPGRALPLLPQPHPKLPNYHLPLDEVAHEQHAEDAEPHKGAAHPKPVNRDRGGEDRRVSEEGDTNREYKDHGDGHDPELLVPAVDLRRVNIVKDVHKRFLSTEPAGPLFVPSL